MNKNELADLLNLFELDRDFTSEDLKISYRDLVQIWHPDRFAQNDRLKQRAQKKLIEINEAKIILKDYLGSESKPRPRLKTEPQKSSKPTRAVRSFLNFLSKHPADLTVLATSQRQGADRLLKKSVAEDVSRGSGGMTLFLPSQSKGFVSNKSGTVNLEKILIPVDIKPNPLLAINGAVKLAKTLGVNIAYLHLLLLEIRQKCLS